MKASPEINEQIEKRPDPAMLAEAKESIARWLKEYQRANMPAPSRPHVMFHDDGPTRFSMADPPEAVIEDNRRFVQEAMQDNALFSTRQFQSLYHAWEKNIGRKISYSSQLLNELVMLKMDPVQFYKAAGISRQVFHKLKTDYLYKPSRETAIRCSLALHHSFDRACFFMHLAGHSFSPCDSRDLALRYCLDYEIYDLSTVNALLDALDEKPLA